MKEPSAILTCDQVRAFDIVSYLSSLGFEPVRVRGQDYWYLSPLRREKTASFKVNRKLNRWYDHGMGKGGNLIDFAILFHHCTISELLQSLTGNLSFHKPPLIQAGKPEQENRIIIKEIRPLYSLVLIRYLHSRHIPLHIAEQFCKEVSYTWDNKNYYSIGFRNDMAGFELRNSFCKNSSAPKGSTTVKNGSLKVMVFEGFFDFLSMVTILSKNDFKKWDYCILNSLSLIEKIKPVLEQYASIHLFLDNDKAGQNCSRILCSGDTKYNDESRLYQHYKDLNEWLVGMGKKLMPGLEKPS